MSEATIPPASVTGRVGKAGIGAIQVYYSVVCAVHFESLTRPSLVPGVWPFVALALWLLPAAVGLGFGRERDRGARPLWLALAGAAVTMAVDGWIQGVPWGRITAMYLLALTLYVHLHVGVSHLLAAAAGLPGCEMRVIPYYLTRLRSGDAEAELCLCPGFWTPIDRWEARWRAGRDA